MNEQPEEFYVLQEQYTVRELVSASAADPMCTVWVGRSSTSPGRACAHEESEHVTTLETSSYGLDRWSSYCAGCIRERVPKSYFESLSNRASGYDHAYTPPRRPTPAVQSDERAAA